jgi:uncharacterized protein (TIGR03083 family)
VVSRSVYREPVSIDFAEVIGSESGRLVAALDANPDAAIPWCGSWTVKECARHVGAAHHVVAKVIEDRPTTDFGYFASLDKPKVSDPALSAWVAEGTAALLDQLGRTPPDDACWSWWPTGGTPAFWARRMAHETLVHRWDAERGAGGAPAPMDPAVASDSLDEYLDVFVGLVRHIGSSPGAGESVHVHCTDVAGEWLLSFPGPGQRELRREHAKGDVALRGTAEGLLLYVWGRQDAAQAGVEVVGDQALLGRWRELIPAI